MRGPLLGCLNDPTLTGGRIESTHSLPPTHQPHHTTQNSKFQHGVPKLKGNPERAGPRFSIIAWGRRRSLNERNSSETARLEQQPLRGPSEQEGGRYCGGGGGGGGYHAHKAKPKKAEAEEEEAVALPEMGKDDARPAPIDMGTVVALVERLVVQEAAKKKKQTGPGASKGSSSSASGAAPQGSAAAPSAAVGGEKAKAAAGGRRRGRVQHSWAS